MKQSWVIELLVASVLFATSATWGTVYWKRSFEAGRQPAFYQLYFEPAVMVACRHGFLRANPPVPAVSDFLQLKRDSLTCADIPPNRPLTDRGLYQKGWLYLVGAVGLAWRVLGISWSGLGPMFGMLFGGTILGAYGIFRFGMGRVVSVICAAGLAVSSVHLQNLPHLRDYAKAPFTLALTFLIFAAVSRPVTWRRLLTIAAAYGVVLGVGYGFRTDFLIDIPLFAIVLALFLEGGVLRNIPMKLAAGVVCAAVFAATAWPVIRAVQQGGGCQWHAALLGLTDGPSDALMVTKAPYGFGHDFSDGFMYSTATAYALRTGTPPGHIEYCSPAYDAVTGRYLVEIAKAFPGDMITRAIASIVQVLQLPFRWFDQPLPGRWNTFYRLRLIALKPLRGSGIVFVSLALLSVAAVSPRLGLFGLFVVFYVGGYPMLQFDIRHYFHLEFLTWWAMGFLAHHLVIHWRSMPERRMAALIADLKTRYSWMRGLKTLSAVTAGVVVALWASRGWQQVQARRLFQEYVDAPKTAVDLGSRDAGVLHRMTLGHDPASDPYPADMLEIDFAVARCGAMPSVTFLYDRPFDAFAHTVALGDRSPSIEPTRVFEPIYSGFAGLRFGDVTPDCVKGAYRLEDPERFPLLLGTTLAPGWRQRALFEQLAPLRWRR